MRRDYLNLAAHATPHTCHHAHPFLVIAVGLRGSNAIAADYVERGVNVYAVLQNEMSGYPGSQRKITILQDYVDEELTVRAFTHAIKVP